MRLSAFYKTLILAILIAILHNSGLIRAQSDSARAGNLDVNPALSLIGLNFTGSEIDSMIDDLEFNRKCYSRIREINISNDIALSLQFNPVPEGFVSDSIYGPIKLGEVNNVRIPSDKNELAFYSVRQLGELIKTGQITSVELTEFFIERLKKHDPLLHCVITLTEELALKQAAAADNEITNGIYRGPLHGIPYGAKDLLAARGYKTTWGATPYKDQLLEYDATVIKKLEEAGAVLTAKLSLGALAWGDVWYADTTRNPWNLKQGSSGSSAGSASAVAAGLLPFAIGSETWGSIVSPSTRCGTTGLRPTFGRVSRSGAMALSWTMDKIGPICRSAEDCAIVFDAIRGPDGKDLTVSDYPFNYSPDIDLKTMKIGYLKSDFEKDTTFYKYNNLAISKLQELGADLKPIYLPTLPVEPLQIILLAEAAAAFDDLTRSNRDDLLANQIKNSWPNVFRSSRLIPAVEYIQANRLRSMLIHEMDKIFKDIDIYVSPTFYGDNLLLTNLTGHPCVVIPNGFNENNEPVSITFIGGLFNEAELLAFAKAYQDETVFHLKHPDAFTR